MKYYIFLLLLGSKNLAEFTDHLLEQKQEQVNVLQKWILCAISEPVRIAVQQYLLANFHHFQWNISGKLSATS